MSGVFGADIGVMLHRKDGCVDGEECVLRKQKNRIKKRKLLDKNASCVAGKSAFYFSESLIG